VTELFAVERRAEVLTSLVTFLRVDEQIAGLVQVGSGAKEGVQDQYGGIDLLVVIKNGAVFPSVYRKWRERIVTLFPVSFSFESKATAESALYSLMLNDYMEINLYFTRVQNLKAETKPWKVLFDQTETQDIEPILEATYQAERVAAPSRTYARMMASIWQPIIKCVIAMNRDETWRALYMLEQVREQTIELAAMNYGVDTANYAEVDQLPEMLLVSLRHSVPTAISQIAIRRALRATTTIFFAQAELLEETVDYRLADSLKKKILPYIDAYA